MAALTRFLALTRNRYTNGMAFKAAVLQAKTQFKTTQAQAIDIGIPLSHLRRTNTDKALRRAPTQRSDNFRFSDNCESLIVENRRTKEDTADETGLDCR